MMNSKVDFYFNKANKWSEEQLLLRNIILECGLTEELKWGAPCYTLNQKNVVLIHAFKDYCAVLFFKGALLENIDHILVTQSENVQATKQARFTNVDEILKVKSELKAIIYQAIEVEKAGLKVELKKTKDFEVAAEFQFKLDHFAALKTAFEALTPGRQRAYLLYFSSAKQAKTREARIEKYIPTILEGKGLDD